MALNAINYFSDSSDGDVSIGVPPKSLRKECLRSTKMLPEKGLELRPHTSNLLHSKLILTILRAFKFQKFSAAKAINLVERELSWKLSLIKLRHCTNCWFTEFHLT
jgi:hypothetical protein